MCALRNHRVVAVASLHIVEVASRRRDTIAAAPLIAITRRTTPRPIALLRRVQVEEVTDHQHQVVAVVAVTRVVDRLIC